MTGNEVGSKANYYCNEGFELLGDDHSVCLKTGYWSAKEPVCKRKWVKGESIKEHRVM